MIKIENTKKELYDSSEIKFLIDFLKDKKPLIDLLSSLYNNFNKKHTNLNSDDKNTYRFFLESSCEVYKKIYNYEEQEINKFINYWMNLTNKEMGLFLENIVICIGPISFCESENIQYKRESKVFSIEKYENNMDVIFYDSKKSKVSKCKKKLYIKSDSEFIECKRDISNFIPRDKNKKIKKNTIKNKIEFMHEISNLYPNSSVYFVTFTPATSIYEDYLKEHEFFKIKVYSLMGLLEPKYN